MSALGIAATGMLAQQMNIKVIANNIANLTTTGYKRQRGEFQDLLYQNILRPGSSSSDVGTLVPSGIQMGTGVKAAAVYRIHQQGGLQITDNPLDLAINGEGYFQIDLPTGETGYTRAGSFQVNAEGLIVTPNGYSLLPGITVPDDAEDITVNNNGEVLIKLAGQVDLVNAGQIELANFANDPGLEAIGENLFLETPASGTAIPGIPGSEGYGSIEQGTLENSNVDSVTEITNMITAQRAYEMNSKVIRTADEMLNTVNQVR